MRHRRSTSPATAFASTMIPSHLLLFLLLLSLSTVPPCIEGKKLPRVKAGKMHELHQPVHVVVNKVGPFNNPIETYRYYSLPYCRTHSTEEEHKALALELNLDEHAQLAAANLRRDREGAMQHKQRLGERLVGDRRETSPFELTFGDNVEYLLLCAKTLTPDEISQFKEAIHNNYFFEMFIDDLPMWGYIGEVVGEDLLLGDMGGTVGKTYLYTHLHFKMGYFDGRIVTASLKTKKEKRVDITDATKPTSKPIQFSYSVEWYEETDIQWKDRMSRYMDNKFLPQGFEIHWLSIINAVVLVLLMTAFLTIIMMRVLRNDLSRYMEMDEETLEEEESGWKLIHGDVFRFPTHPELFCAFYGTGIQLILATFSLLTLALLHVVSVTRRGSILAGMIVLYCLTSIMGGYVSQRLYRQMNGRYWIKNVLWTFGLFPVPVMMIFSYVNTVAMLHGSNSALPFGTIFLIGCLFVFLAFPLTLGGAIMARNVGSGQFNPPTRTTKIARQIPTDVPWYKSRPSQMIIAGFLPFSSIYIELNYIFQSVWGHQIYTLFGILFLAQILLIITSACITIALLYFQLLREDHKWWWTTFVNGGSTGIFLGLYSIYYYFSRSGMTGALQSSFYFGYMAIISYAFVLMLGAASFRLSLVFVKGIYSRLKID